MIELHGKKFYTVEETAIKLKKTEQSIYNYIYNGILKPATKKTRPIYIPESEILKFFEMEE